jgi:predicted permease
MTNISMLFLSLIAGMAMRVTDRLPENTHVGLNAIIVHIALPALILSQVHGVNLTTDVRAVHRTSDRDISAADRAGRGTVVISKHGLNPVLVTLMVGIGITLSFLTLPMWWWALSAI